MILLLFRWVSVISFPLSNSEWKILDKKHEMENFLGKTFHPIRLWLSSSSLSSSSSNTKWKCIVLSHSYYFMVDRRVPNYYRQQVIPATHPANRTSLPDHQCEERMEALLEDSPDAIFQRRWWWQAEWWKWNNCFNGEFNNCSNKYHGQSQSSSFPGTFTVLLHSHVIQSVSYCFIFRRNVNFPNESQLNIASIRRLPCYKEEHIFASHVQLRPGCVILQLHLKKWNFSNCRQYPVQMHLFPY